MYDALPFSNHLERLRLAPMPRWVHAWSWGGFLLLTVAMAVAFYFLRDVNVWAGWREARGLRNPGYAEAVFVDSVFRTRANTWSNLSYVIVGLYVIALAALDLRRNYGQDAPYLVRTPALGFLFGVACVYLGVGSGIYHASLTRWGQQLDVAAMYSPLVVLIAMNFGRWLPRLPGTRLPTWPVWCVGACIASALLYVYKWEMSSKQVLPALILTVAFFSVGDFLSRRWHLSHAWLAGAFFTLLVAFTCRQLDVAGRFSGPDDWWQGHAIWHVLSGATLGCIYLYYRSEYIAPRPSANPEARAKPGAASVVTPRD